MCLIATRRRQDFLKKHRLTPSGIPCFAMISKKPAVAAPCTVPLVLWVARGERWAQGFTLAVMSKPTAQTPAKARKTSEAVERELAGFFRKANAQNNQRLRANNYPHPSPDLQALDLFITNDSGSMHIAAALGVPMVAIFGPTNMRETAPWRARDCALLNLNLPCAPCKKRVCPLGHHKCMKDLRPEMVIEAALAILHKPKLSK